MKNLYYHICIRRTDSKQFCFTENDYCVMVKSLAFSSLKHGITIIAYCVMSNHIHILVTQKSKNNSIHNSYDEFQSSCTESNNLLNLNKFTHTILLKYSRHLNIEYLNNLEFRRSTLITKKVVKTNRYLTNTLAYIIRNAKDNGYPDVLNYKWSSAKCLFREDRISTNSVPIKSFTVNERRQIMHCRSIDHWPEWYITSEGYLEAASFCDWRTAEMILESKENFISVLNNVQMKNIWHSNVELLSNRLSDNELYLELNNISCSIFKVQFKDLSYYELSKVIKIAKTSICTSAKQLSRVCQMPLTEINKL